VSVLRVATWNVNSLNARMPRVVDWLADVQPDVVCLQETKLTDVKFPAMEFATLGYEAIHHGINQWNGVAILSRVGLERAHQNFDDGAAPDDEARIVSATCAGIRVTSVYVPNGRSLDHEHYQYKLRWLERLRLQLVEHASPDEPMIIAGDYNIAPADIDIYDPSKFTESTHASAAEREALDGLKAFGLADLSRIVTPDAQFFSWWDYRAGDFHQGRGLRIDLLLGSAPVQAAVRWGVVDRNARKGTQPSDHAPVIIDLDWPVP
jgi:exodeoxyribonuclease III